LISTGEMCGGYPRIDKGLLLAAGIYDNDGCVVKTIHGKVFINTGLGDVKLCPIQMKAISLLTGMKKPRSG